MQSVGPDELILFMIVITTGFILMDIFWGNDK